MTAPTKTMATMIPIIAGTKYKSVMDCCGGAVEEGEVIGPSPTAK